MNRLLGVVVGLTWAVVAGLGFGSRPHEIRSFAQATESVISAVILVWPVALAAGAAAAVRRRRSGLDERLSAWPGNARARMAMRATGTMWTWTAAFAVATFAVVGVLAWTTGSVPSLATLPGLGIALLGVASLMAWGGVLGTLVPSYVMAAVAAVAHYLVSWLLPEYSVFHIFGFTGTTALIGQAVRLDGRALLVLALWQSATLCAALAVQYLLTAGVGASARRVQALRVGAVTLVAVAATAFALGPTGPRMDPWTLQGMASWDCTEVDNFATVCLPKDMRAAHDEYVRGMQIVAEGLRPLVGEGRRLVISSATLPRQDPSEVYVQVETSFAPTPEDWAGSLTMSIAMMEGEPDAFSDECLDRTIGVAERWEQALRGSGQPPEAAAMRALTRACRP